MTRFILRKRVRKGLRGERESADLVLDGKVDEIREVGGRAGEIGAFWGGCSAGIAGGDEDMAD
jgi:hypothetical protein